MVDVPLGLREAEEMEFGRLGLGDGMVFDGGERGREGVSWGEGEGEVVNGFGGVDIFTDL